MKNKRYYLVVLAFILSLPTSLSAVAASPEEDRKAFVKYFQSRFPDVPVNDYANGLYAIDKQSREQWEAIEEFPPYEEGIESGEVLYNTPFANGKGYSDCFGDGAVRHKYPYFDTKAKEVITMELAINRCREVNGEKPLKWQKNDIANLSAYMSYQSRGQIVNVQIPNDDALAAYEEGKKFYYSKRGYLNNSCATCHVQGAGFRVRTEILHPALGETTHWPVFRLKWDHLGTLHKRIRACHRDQGAKPFKAQSEIYRNVEYFMSYMSNGLPFNGPGVRK